LGKDAVLNNASIERGVAKNFREEKRAGPFGAQNLSLMKEGQKSRAFQKILAPVRGEGEGIAVVRREREKRILPPDRRY